MIRVITHFVTVLVIGIEAATIVGTEGLENGKFETLDDPGLSIRTSVFTSTGSTDTFPEVPAFDQSGKCPPGSIPPSIQSANLPTVLSGSGPIVSVFSPLPPLPATPIPPPLDLETILVLAQILLEPILCGFAKLLGRVSIILRDLKPTLEIVLSVLKNLNPLFTGMIAVVNGLTYLLEEL